jgi:hypothetical protein
VVNLDDLSDAQREGLYAILNCPMIALNDEHVFVDRECIGCGVRDGRDAS